MSEHEERPEAEDQGAGDESPAAGTPETSATPRAAQEGEESTPSETAADETRGSSETAAPASTSVTAPSTEAPADVVQTVTNIDRAIKRRRETDIKLVNWWLYFLLLSWITLGIYTIYLYFKRINRIDNFSERKHSYYQATIEWTQRQAEATGQEGVVRNELSDLNSEVERAYNGEMKRINSVLSFVLTLITLGIWGFYVLYRMNNYWWHAQVLEQDFDDKVSQQWTKLGFIKYPISFEVDRSKEKSYALYLILTIVTLGIWGLVWDHKIHTDPDNLFGHFHGVEDTVLQTVRAR